MLIQIVIHVIQMERYVQSVNQDMVSESMTLCVYHVIFQSILIVFLVQIAQSAMNTPLTVTDSVIPVPSSTEIAKNVIIVFACSAMLVMC